LWQNTAYISGGCPLRIIRHVCNVSGNVIHNICRVMFKDEIFTNIQTGCNLVKNSLNDLQTVRILPLNNPLPLGAFTNPSLFCFLCHDQWVLANHSSSLQPLLLLHRSLVRLFWSFTWNNNAQILHLGRCECEFGSTMAR
jgi:hypothetical protein